MIQIDPVAVPPVLGVSFVQFKTANQSFKGQWGTSPVTDMCP